MAFMNNSKTKPFAYTNKFIFVDNLKNVSCLMQKIYLDICQNTQQDGVVVTLYAYICEVLGSNLGRNTGWLD
jgi:hypothetical protein